jgi:hypothetical protein
MAVNGGYQAYPGKVTKDIFYKAEDRTSDVFTMKSGNVAKAFTFIEYILSGNDKGKVKPYQGGQETNNVTFLTGLTTSGQTITIAGLILTCNAAMTVAEIVTAFDNKAPGVATVDGTKYAFTGTLAGFAISKSSDSTLSVVTSGLGSANATDLVVTSATTTFDLDIIQGDTLPHVIAGILLYDVDATSADTRVSAWIEVSLWADAIVWSVDIDIDTIVNASGAIVAVTQYNTGCAGNSDYSNRLKQMFVANSEFSPLGFHRAGDYYNDGV